MAGSTENGLAGTKPNLSINLKRFPNNRLLVHFNSWKINASKVVVVDLESHEIHFKGTFEEESISASDLSHDGSLLLIGFWDTKSLKLFDLNLGKQSMEYAINGIDGLQTSTNGDSFIFKSVKPVDVDNSMKKQRGTFLVRNGDIGNATKIRNTAKLSFGCFDHRRDVFYLPTRKKGQVFRCDFRSGEVRTIELNINSTVCSYICPAGETLALDDGTGRIHLYDTDLTTKRLTVNCSKLLSNVPSLIKFHRYSCTFARGGSQLVLSQAIDESEDGYRVIVVNTDGGEIVDDFSAMRAGFHEILPPPSTGDLVAMARDDVVNLKTRELYGCLRPEINNLLATF